MDPKSQVNDFMMRTLQRSVRKIDDFKYITYGVSAGFQSLLTLSCFGGEAYLGDVCTSRKEAERSAATKALAENTEFTSPSKKRKTLPAVHCQCIDQEQGASAEEELKFTPEFEIECFDETTEAGKCKVINGH
jgi:hypothetical protein